MKDEEAEIGPILAKMDSMLSGFCSVAMTKSTYKRASASANSGPGIDCFSGISGIRVGICGRMKYGVVDLRTEVFCS